MDILLLGILFIILFFKLIACLIRGGKRSFVRLGFTVLAAVAAFFLAKPLAAFVIGKLDFSLLNESETLRDLSLASPTFASVISKLPTLLAAPVLFFVLFALLTLLFGIPSAIINRKIEKGQTGLALIATLLLTFFSFTVAYGPIATVGSAASKVFMPFIETAVKEVGDDPALSGNAALQKIVGKLTRHQFSDGVALIGRPMLSELSSVREGGKRFSLSEEALQLVPFASKAAELSAAGGDFESLLEGLPELARHIDESPLLGDTLREAAVYAGGEWNAGRSCFGIDPENADDLAGLLVLYVTESPENFSAAEFADFVAAFLEGSELPDPSAE